MCSRTHGIVLRIARTMWETTFPRLTHAGLGKPINEDNMRLSMHDASLNPCGDAQCGQKHFREIPTPDFVRTLPQSLRRSPILSSMLDSYIYFQNPAWVFRGNVFAHMGDACVGGESLETHSRPTGESGRVGRTCRVVHGHINFHSIFWMRTLPVPRRCCGCRPRCLQMCSRWLYLALM